MMFFIGYKTYILKCCCRRFEISQNKDGKVSATSSKLSEPDNKSNLNASDLNVPKLNVPKLNVPDLYEIDYIRYYSKEQLSS